MYGKGKKTRHGTSSELEIETPRDRASTFEPQPIMKRQIRLAIIEIKNMSLHVKGMTTWRHRKGPAGCICGRNRLILAHGLG